MIIIFFPTVNEDNSQQKTHDDKYKEEFLK